MSGKERREGRAFREIGVVTWETKPLGAKEYSLRNVAQISCFIYFLWHRNHCIRNSSLSSFRLSMFLLRKLPLYKNCLGMNIHVNGFTKQELFC
jgi:hypothetical protein